MRRPYTFTLKGSAAGGQSWTTTGSLTCEFHELMELVMQETFQQLTAGRAQFGNPGLGCRGPYDITEVSIKQVLQ
jgi:hypothetical protein